MVVLKYIAPDLAETTSFGAGSEQLGWGRRGAQGAGREEGYIAAALASIDRRLIFCSDCQDACASSSCACTQAFYLDLDSSFAITRTDPTTHLSECCSCCPTGLRAPRSSWTATLALYTGLSITSEMFLARAEQKVGRTIVATTCAFVKCRITVFRTWLYAICVRADLFHVGAFGLHWCLIAEGAPTGAEIDSSVPGNEPTSMRSSSLEVMAALPLDGSLGLRPEEDYTYVDQPWNRSFLFGMPFRHVLPQAADWLEDRDVLSADVCLPEVWLPAFAYRCGLRRTAFCQPAVFASASTADTTDRTTKCGLTSEGSSRRSEVVARFCVSCYSYYGWQLLRRKAAPASLRPLIVVTGRYFYIGRFCLFFWKVILSQQQSEAGIRSANAATCATIR